MPPKRQHGSEYNMDGATDGEGDGAFAGTVITESAATMADTPDPNLANNTATVSIKVQ